MVLKPSFSPAARRGSEFSSPTPCPLNGYKYSLTYLVSALCRAASSTSPAVTPAERSDSCKLRVQYCVVPASLLAEDDPAPRCGSCQNNNREYNTEVQDDEPLRGMGVAERAMRQGGARAGSE